MTNEPVDALNPTVPLPEKSPSTPTSEQMILQLQEEVKEERNKSLRLLADMENLRKRLHKEKMEMNRFAIENILSEILAPLDHFENALKHIENSSEETKNWAKGFEMILAQFKEILNQYNIKPFTSVGTLFDPHKQEAVEIEETDDVPEGTITKEFLKGYQSGDRIIRVARVKVAKKLPNK